MSKQPKRDSAILKQTTFTDVEYNPNYDMVFKRVSPVKIDPRGDFNSPSRTGAEKDHIDLSKILKEIDSPHIAENPLVREKINHESLVRALGEI